MHNILGSSSQLSLDLQSFTDRPHVILPEILTLCIARFSSSLELYFNNYIVFSLASLMSAEIAEHKQYFYVLLSAWDRTWLLWTTTSMC